MRKFANVEVRRRYYKFVAHLQNQRASKLRQADANDLARPVFPFKAKLADKSEEELKVNNSHRILTKYWLRRRDREYQSEDVVDASLFWQVMPVQKEHAKQEERRLRDKGLL